MQPGLSVFSKARWRKAASLVLLACFILNSVLPSPTACAQLVSSALPSPGLVTAGQAFNPVMMKGLKIFDRQPFRFDLLLDKGDSGLAGDRLQEEAARLSRFFLASLAVPERDMWVNLSPVEHDRVIPDAFATTDMGQVLLEQDYLLKQVAASLTYPETALGSAFWAEVYRRVYAAYGTIEVSPDAVNKVWIVPAAAQVYTHRDSVFVTRSELDVLTDADYRMLKTEMHSPVEQGVARIYTDVFREMMLPELRRQVNHSERFAPVRQVYNALILATWYKRHWAESLLGHGYVGSNKVRGIDDVPLSLREEVFGRYLKSVREGVYSYVREEPAASGGDVVPRKYFSGGVVLEGILAPGVYLENGDASQLVSGPGLWRAPLVLEQAGAATDASPAAAWRTRRLVRKAVTMTLLALSGMSFLPAASQAATFAPSKDGRAVTVTLDKGETYGEAVEGLRLAYRALDAEGYANSGLAGRLWGKGGVIARVSDGARVDRVAGGVPLTVRAVVSPEVLAQLNKSEPATAQAAGGTELSKEESIQEKPPAVAVPAADSLAAENIKPAGPESVKVAKPAPEPGRFERVLGSLTEQISSATEEAVRTFDLTRTDWKNTAERSFLYALTLLAAVNLGRTIKELAGSSAAAEASAAAGGAGSGKGPGDEEDSLKPVVPEPEEDELAILDGMVASAQARVGAPSLSNDGDEERSGAQFMDGLLAQARERVRQAVSEKTKTSSVAGTVPARRDPWPMLGMDMFNAVAAGFMLSGIDGGWLAAAGLGAFAGRLFLAGNVWLHEFGHMLVSGFRTGEWREAFSSANLRAYLSAGDWRRMLSAFRTTADQDPHVLLPSSADSTLVRRAGSAVTLSAGLAAGAVLLQAGLFWPLVPLAVATAAVLYGARKEWRDVSGDGIFRCGILGLERFVPENAPVQGMSRELAGWMEGMVRNLEDRGGQQMGMFTFVQDDGLAAEAKGVKALKNKRGVFWRGNSPVFYPDIVGKMVRKATAKVSRSARSLDNFGRGALAGFVAHVRFATGGEIVQNAAHPFTSPYELKKIYAFDNTGELVSQTMPVQVLAAQNGDNDAVRMGGLQGEPSGEHLNVGQMRRFFPAASHMYYEGKVTARYLKRVIGELLPEGYPKVEYGRLLSRLREGGFVVKGRVSRRFAGIDEGWRRQYPEYDEELLALVESALYDLPPGDSPVVPLEIRLFMGQGDWDSSVRYAHYMAGHPDGKGVQEDILFEDEERAAGAVMERVFEQARPYVTRKSFQPQDKVRSLSDCWFADDDKARSAGAGDQRLRLDKFEQLLALEMRYESARDTQAGRIFRRWEERWKEAYGDSDAGRRAFVASAVRQFFLADREHAVRELATRAEGTYGVFAKTTVGDNGITLLRYYQDVAAAYDEDRGIFAFASDPRVLKTEGPKGERLKNAIHFEDGEVANLSFTSQGDFRMRVWKKDVGVLSDDEVRRRIYPTWREVIGKPNQYYAPPPVAYKQRREMVAEDLDNIPKVLAEAGRTWDDPESFNRQSTRNLAERLAAVKSRTGTARLLVVGYDNSFTVSDMLNPVLAGLVDGLKVDSVDANDFIRQPDSFAVDGNTVVLVVSKSGATFPTNLAAKLLMRLVSPENVFGMTARIDSVLNTVLGQGLRLEDQFTKRIFLTGEFYPSEAPVLSEQLLLYQQVRMVLRLASELRGMEGNPLNVGLEPDKLGRLESLISEGMLDLSVQAVGIDPDSRPKPGEWSRELRAIGDKLGWNFFRPFVVNRAGDILVYGIFKLGAPVAGLLALMSAGMVTVPNLLGLWGVTAALDWLFTKYIFPFLTSEVFARWHGLPRFGRLGARKLFVSAPQHIGRMQRNFLSRLFANGLASTSPAAIHDADPVRDLVAEHASDVARGDIFLNLVLEHSRGNGAMSLRQATFPKTGAFAGSAWLRGRAGHEDVLVRVPDMGDKRRQDIVDATLGQFGLMIAAKVIGVTMSMRASWRGRLWNPGESWSRAGVHTTPTPTGVTPRAQEILSGHGRSGSDLAQSSTGTRAGIERRSAKDFTPGGIDLDARQIRIDETAGPAGAATGISVTAETAVEGFVPIVGPVVPVLSGVTLPSPD